jgi:hypothetical protein
LEVEAGLRDEAVDEAGPVLHPFEPGLGSVKRAVEQVFADLEDSALAHLPSGKFTENAAWLTLAATAYNLTRAAGHLASTFHARARTGTIRRHLINIPARVATGARRLTLHLPERWRWADDFTDLWITTGQQTPT